MSTSNSETIFVCYSDIDKLEGADLYRQLKSDGFNVWSAQEDILVGQTRKIEIENIIEKSYAILICLSSKSVGSTSTLQSGIRAAMEMANEKPEGVIFIIPVLFDECVIPNNLPNVLPAKLYEENGYSKLVKSLIVLKEQFENIEENMTQTNQLITKMKEKARENELRFAVIGLVGAGKSSTINSIFGKTVAKVNPYEAETHSVSSYSNESLGVKYTIFDTPGLGESEDEGLNTKYINEMKMEIKEVDCVLYLTHLDDPRVRGDEKRCIRLFSEAFGASVWKHSVIVFTLKHPMSETEYQTTLSNRTKLIQEEIYKHANVKETGLVPATTVSISSGLTPDNKDWESELFLRIFERISDINRWSFYIANSERINNKEIPLSKEQENGILDKLAPTAQALTEGFVILGKSALRASAIGGAALIGGSVAGIPGALVGSLLAMFGIIKFIDHDL